MKAFAIIGGMILILGGIVGGFLWSRNVEIRVPQNFRGFIRIRPNIEAPAPRIGLFKLIIEVPKSGELALPSLDIVRRMHRQEASFSDGTPLLLKFPGDVFSGIALQVMNSPPTEQVFYFVGTREELLTYLKENRDRLYSVHK